MWKNNVISKELSGSTGQTLKSLVCNILEEKYKGFLKETVIYQKEKKNSNYVQTLLLEGRAHATSKAFKCS